MIRTNRAHLYVNAQTHPGLSGKNNEDNFAVSAYTISSKNPTPSVLAIVSDGIGGHNGGEIASELAVNLISEMVENREGGHPLAIFENSFRQASKTIFEKAEKDSILKGMGATASVVWIIGTQLYIAYVGDSRIYLIRNRTIRQLSRDHTWLQEAIEKKIIDPSSGLKNHPNMHIIRRYLGSMEPPEPDLRLFLQPRENDKQARNNQGTTLAAGDVVLLCTDGLSDLSSNSEIADTLIGKTLQQSAQALINLACERGGHDNISVVLLGVPWNSQNPDPGWLPG